MTRQFAQKAMDIAAQVASSQASEARRSEQVRKDSEQAVSRVTQLEAQSREAWHRKEHEQAAALMRQAEQLRAELASKARNADMQAMQGKQGVREAIDRIRQSEEILNQALDAEAKAHQGAAREALSARDEIGSTLEATTKQIDDITGKLKDGLKITLEADSKRFKQAIVDLDKALAEKEYLIQIAADLQAAEKQLKEYEALLKEGKTLPVHADVGKAREALDKLKVYADENAQFELKVVTGKAQAAITNVDNMIRSLDRIQTESRHSVHHNAAAARAEVMSLNGIRTSSKHTIYVTRVRTNATGGLVSSGVQRFAKGGSVASSFPRMRAGWVPGSGHHDTVPRMLDTGAFVIRKAAVRKYGGSALARLLTKGTQFASGARPASAAVPSLLTPGEFVFSKEVVARYGTDFFEAVNNLGAPAQALAGRTLAGIQGFADGGLVQPSFAGRRSLLRPSVPDSSPPARTVRVELAAGNNKVDAAVDARDESRLLQLLNAARARTV